MATTSQNQNHQISQIIPDTTITSGGDSRIAKILFKVGARQTFRRYTPLAYKGFILPG